VKKISYSVIYTLLILTVFLLPGFTYAFEENDDTIHLKIKTVKFKPTPLQLRKVLVRALLNYNWQIKTVDNNKITAENDQAYLRVKFLDDESVKLSLTSQFGGSPRSKWLRSIKKFTHKELQYYYFIQKFDQSASNEK